jgi:hypothetical protein
LIETIAVIGFIDNTTIELRLDLGREIDATIQPRVPAGLEPPDEYGVPHPDCDLCPCDHDLGGGPCQLDGS